MSIADIVHYHNRSLTREFGEGWWAEPLLIVSALIGGIVLYSAFF